MFMVISADVSAYFMTNQLPPGPPVILPGCTVCWCQQKEKSNSNYS